MTNKKRFYEEENLTLLELLSIDRTILANERTFFAYIRASLSMALAGLTFITFIEHKIFITIGYTFIPLSFLIIILAARRYMLVNDDLRKLGKKNTDTE